MKKIAFLLFIFTLNSCISVKKYNERLETPISSEKLKQDIDYAYLKLQKLHPTLYTYIPKEKLDYKFDSLKNTIQQPLKPLEFYFKLAPVVAEVRQGHLRLVPPEKKLTKKEIKKLKEQKGLLGRLSYYLENDKLYVKDNPEKVANIKNGSEIIAINNLEIEKLLKKYEPLITSDGYNTTYQKYSMARRFPTFFTVEYGIMDSVKIDLKSENTLDQKLVTREKKSKEDKKKEKTDKKPTEEKKTKDYNPVTKSFNRNLKFLEKDSSIAYIKIKTFSGTYSQKFYRETFREIKKAKSKYLILDIRDNLGGSLAEITNLYSYLAKDKFRFINDFEIANRTSITQADYFSHFPNYLKPIAAIGYLQSKLTSLLMVRHKNDKYYLKSQNIFTPKKPKKDAFEGEIYVLINGSSFSASSVISAKLKNDKRAMIIGEETGGANDGTVAGIYSTQKLPNSKLKLPIGLFLVQPNIEFTHTMKGVTPDVEIKPTFQQILERKDIELEWILKEIKGK